MRAHEFVERVQSAGPRTGEAEVVVTIGGEPYVITDNIDYDEELEAVAIEVMPA